MRYLRVKSLLLAIMMSAAAVVVVLPRSAYAQPTVPPTKVQDCNEGKTGLAVGWGERSDEGGYWCQLGWDIDPDQVHEKAVLTCPEGSHSELGDQTRVADWNFIGFVKTTYKTKCVPDGHEAVVPAEIKCDNGNLKPKGTQWDGYWCEGGAFDGVERAVLTCPEGAAVEEADLTNYTTTNTTKQKCVKNPPAGEGGEGEGDGGAAEGEGKPECGSTVEGLGYLICPILEHAARFSDSMWGFFESLLYVNPLSNKTDDSIYKTWVMLRDLANVILAIVFIAVIISQISNAGISNYGIKKILPRLIIAAITINISYFLMQALIDIANIAGKSFDDCKAKPAWTTQKFPAGKR